MGVCLFGPFDAGCEVDVVHSFSSRLISLLACKHAVLNERVTDEGLRALASAGCGENLTALTLSGECLFRVHVQGRRKTHGHSRSSRLFPCNRAVLHESVTDKGLRALASAGCGKRLTLLNFESECDFLLW